MLEAQAMACPVALSQLPARSCTPDARFLEVDVIRWPWVHPAVRATLVVWIVCLSFGGSARAHDGVVFGTFPFADGTSLYGGGTSWGLIEVEEDEALWTCSEVLGVPVFWWYRAIGGPTLAGTGIGLRSSVDGGCSWQIPEGPIGQMALYSAIADPLDTAHLFVSTADAQTENHLMESTDGGLTWSSVFSAEGVVLWRSAVAPGAQELVVLGVPEDGGAPRLWGSVDGGSSWSPSPKVLDGWAAVVLFDVSSDAERVYFSGQKDGRFSVGAVPVSLEGEVELLGTFSQSVNGLVEFGGGFHLLMGWNSSWTWDGVNPPVETDTGTSACLSRRGDILWGCGGAPLHSQFSWSDDGVTWQGALSHEEVTQRSCPDDSEAAAVCPQVWESIQAALNPMPPGDDDDSADGGAEPLDCAGCSAILQPNGSWPGWLLVGLLVGLSQRLRPRPERRS